MERRPRSFLFAPADGTKRRPANVSRHGPQHTSGIGMCPASPRVGVKGGHDEFSVHVAGRPLRCLRNLLDQSYRSTKHPRDDRDALPAPAGPHSRSRRVGPLPSAITMFAKGQRHSGSLGGRPLYRQQKTSCTAAKGRYSVAALPQPSSENGTVRIDYHLSVRRGCCSCSSLRFVIFGRELN